MSAAYMICNLKGRLQGNPVEENKFALSKPGKGVIIEKIKNCTEGVLL